MSDKLRSFHEFMPEDVWKWKIIEQQIDNVLSLHNYQEIRLSVLQDYSVLHDGITALMDVIEASQVTKQVLSLTAPDDNVSLLSLRPEGTISVLHHTAKRFQDGDIHRFYYHGPMFRKDKNHQPMEFYQLGVELLGSDSILSENEIISLGMRLIHQLGLQDARLEINSYGCEECRVDFFRDMRQHIDNHKENLCAHCYTELLNNPLADTCCQDDGCNVIAHQGPQIQNYLCEKCKINFHKVKKIQANLANEYKVNDHLFKNFSYYNETVFDIIADLRGVPTVIGGGGRYDYLSQMITGKKIPAVGFYINLDTVFEIMHERNLFRENLTPFAVYICAQTQDMEIMMLQIAQELHEQNIITILSADILPTEVEIKTAIRKGCNVMIILREENIREGKVLIRNLGKEHQDYTALNQIINEILIARKATIQEK
ncbi:MAG: hypothetical protein CVU48_01140 [Candidatus Cloacimonetes bacterium HGW-Cloacimonetes-1]|jgi:histidyl-tRNA synthetase|nr:MAG: hypothetical protein CVU48_01140 [Candidatus Cloacimonetes bacterium HGW-Cloacimonetes-1]